MPEDAEAIAAFGYELGLLKRVRRTGWWHAGVRDPESVAEHTMRTAQLAAHDPQAGKPRRSCGCCRRCVDGPQLATRKGLILA
nr:hypothetical protein Ade03nite_47910 [Actinoplanes derwentensis]